MTELTNFRAVTWRDRKPESGFDWAVWADDENGEIVIVAKDHLDESTARGMAAWQEMLEALKAHDAFWKAILDRDMLWEIDGLQAMAETAGLLKPEPYDPAKHGDSDFDTEPGDEWFVPTDAAQAAIAKASLNPQDKTPC